MLLFNKAIKNDYYRNYQQMNSEQSEIIIINHESIKHYKRNIPCIVGSDGSQVDRVNPFRGSAMKRNLP